MGTQATGTRHLTATGTRHLPASGTRSGNAVKLVIFLDLLSNGLSNFLFIPFDFSKCLVIGVNYVVFWLDRLSLGFSVKLEHTARYLW